MKGVEIILIRTAGDSGEQVCRYLQEIRRSTQDLTASSMRFYVNADVDGDLAVVLSWTSMRVKNRKSDLGLNLATAMRRFGLVDHTCWLAVENDDPYLQ